MAFMRLACICILAIAVLSVSGCNRDTASTEDSRKPVDASISRKLAVVSPGFLSPEMEEMRQASHASSVVFAKDGAGIAYIEPFEGKFRVIHNGQAGKPYIAISELSVSNDGRRIAYVAYTDEKVNRMVVDGKEGYAFGENDNHWFTPDGRHHISTVTEDRRRHLVIDGTVVRDYSIEQGPVISPDSSSLAFSVKSRDGSGHTLIITDLQRRNKMVIDSCGGYIFPNDDASSLAVGCSHGGDSSVRLIDFLHRTVISDNPVSGDITHMRFAPDSRSVVYTVLRPQLQRYIIYNGSEEKIPDGDEFFSDPLVFSEPQGVGAIIGTVYKAYLYRAFQKRNKIGKGYGYIADFVSSKDGRHNAYVATKVNELQMQIVVDGNEGPKFDKIVSPLFSPAGSILVYRARQSGKRFLVVSDMKGKVIRRHRDYDMVFQPVFSADGTSVAYGVLDGNEFWWKVEKVK